MPMLAWSCHASTVQPWRWTRSNSVPVSYLWRCPTQVQIQVHKAGIAQAGTAQSNEWQTIKGLEGDLQGSQCVQRHVFSAPQAEAETTDRRDHILHRSQAGSLLPGFRNVCHYPHPCGHISPIFDAHIIKKCLLPHFCSAWATVIYLLYICYSDMSVSLDIMQRHSNTALYDSHWGTLVYWLRLTTAVAALLV